MQSRLDELVKKNIPVHQIKSTGEIYKTYNQILSKDELPFDDALENE